MRSRVHEYGGARVHRPSRDVYFSNFADQRLYRQTPAHAPRAADGRRATSTPTAASTRRARGCCACARTTPSGEAEPVNTHRRVDLRVAEAHRSTPVLVRAPISIRSALSPDGGAAGLAAVESPQHAVGRHRAVGGAMCRRTARSARARRSPAARTNRSFSPSGRRTARLFFVSRSHGLVEPVSRRAGGAGTGAVDEAMHPMAAEFGKPQWTFSQTTYAFLTRDSHGR